MFEDVKQEEIIDEGLKVEEAQKKDKKDKKASKEDKSLKKEQKKLKKEEKKALKAEKKKNRKGGGFLSFFLPFLFAGISVCVLYFVIGNKTESVILTTDVLYVTNDITKNTFISADEYDTYFKTCSVENDLIPSNAVLSKSVLPDTGIYVKSDLCAQEMLLSRDIATSDAVMERYVNAYKTSIACGSLKNSIAGRVRKGDLVDIFAYDEYTESLQLIASNVYVEQAYDSNGNICSNDNDIATIFTIWTATEEEMVNVNKALLSGNIQLYKAVE